MRGKILAVLLLLFVLFVPKVLAASATNTPVASSYSAAFLEELTRSLNTNIGGVYDQGGTLLKPGAIAFFAQGIDALVTIRPASSLDFAHYLSGRLQFPGAPKVTYAATDQGGIGYNALAPVLPIWLMMRDLAYWFFSIAFVIAGLMIMFRVKIDPKTAATIQSALPKVVFALILVTFSYAIAGLLVDVMYVIIGLVLNLINNIGGGYPDFANKVASQSIFSFWLGEAGETAVPASQAVGQIVSLNLKNALGEVGGQVAGLITGSVAWLIIMVAILWVLFKTWLMLLGAYGNIILNVIFAPIILMFDAIPGQNQFEGWLRNMLAYLLTFPAVIIMIYIGLALSVSSMAIGQTGFVPPLLGGNTQPAAQALVGLAILLTIPKTLEALQQFLKTPQNKFGSAWMEALGWSWAQMSGRAGGAWGRGTGYAKNEAFGASADTFRAQYEAWLKAGGTASGTPEPRPSGWGQQVGILLGASKIKGKS